MGAEPNIGQLITEIKVARRGIEDRDQKTVDRVNELEQSINEILVGMGRPGDGIYSDGRDLERKSARCARIDTHGSITRTKGVGSITRQVAMRSMKRSQRTKRIPSIRMLQT